jgi:uncharacterized damage-inducible protein DinB
VTILAELLAYNAWANERVLEACRGLSAEQLQAPQGDMYGPVLDTLRHILEVEAGYLALIAGAGRPPPAAEGLAALTDQSKSVAVGYERLLGSAGASGLERRFSIPWFEREVTVEQGLAQVVTHSLQHRADVAGALTRAGIEPPPLDFVLFVLEQQEG